jgi:hypothetical protein
MARPRLRVVAVDVVGFVERPRDADALDDINRVAPVPQQLPLQTIRQQGATSDPATA